jgi:hypothetical protein
MARLTTALLRRVTNVKKPPDCGLHQMADSCSCGDTHLGYIKGHAVLAELTIGGD